MNKERPQLKKTLGRVEVFALAFGTMAAWGFVVLPIQWISSGGVLGTVLSFIIATVMCSFVGLIYAELTSAFPLAGAEVAFTYRSMGVPGSWITGWMVCFAYIGIASFEGIALTTALNYLFPLPQWGYIGSISGFNIYFSWVIVGIIGTLILTVLNIIGIKRAAGAQILLLLIMIFTGAVYFFSSFAFGEIDHTQPVIKDLQGVEAILIMAPSMFIGFDMVAKSAEEMNMPIRNVPKILILSICLAGTWYIVITLATYFLLPHVGNENVETIADIAAIVFQSELIKKMIIIGGICGIITTWNGFIVGASRILFAMGRAKLLPDIFSKVHSKYKTPVFAIVFVGLFSCITPFLGPNALSPLLNIVALGTVISYLMVSISFLLIRRREPDLRKEYHIRNGKVIGIVAISCVLFFLFWYTPLSPVNLNWYYEWIFLSVWILIGSVFFIVLKISGAKKSVTPLEREILIFSEEFARELNNKE